MLSSLDLRQADSDDTEQRRQALATAWRLLARREHSTQELVHKLRNRGCPPAVLDEVMTALRDDGVLSDQRFADSYAETRFARGFGPLRIAAELCERGVDEALIDAALADYDSRWPGAARRQRYKRFGPQPPPDFAERARQMRYLQQRGFSGEQIRAALVEEGDAGD